VGQLPLYKVSEDVFPRLGELLDADGLQLLCVESLHLQRDGKTFYRGWEVRDKDGTKAIMWDKHDIGRTELDKTVELTIGIPNRKQGRHIFDRIEQALLSLRAIKLV
jgi:hypothetical protein